MDTPSGDLESSPDPLNDSSDATIALLASSAVRRVTRSQRSNSHYALDGPHSTRSTSISPRKQVFRLDVGSEITPQRLRVTVETEDFLGDSEPESIGTKVEDSVSRRLFNGAASMPAKPTPRRRRQASSSAAPSSPVRSPRKSVATTTTKIPLRGLSDDEYAGATPKRPRGRPRRSGTPLPRNTPRNMLSVSPVPSSPAAGRTPRSTQKTVAEAAKERAAAIADTPASTASGNMISRRMTRATSIESDVDSIGDSRPRKRGRPRRLALAPDEMAAIAEQQEEIDSAAHFYASIEHDEQTADQAHVEDTTGSSPTPTPLSSVDLVKVQTPVPDFDYGHATDYNNDNYLSPIQEMSGIGGDIATIDDGNFDNSHRAPSNMEDAHVDDADATNSDDGMGSVRESSENYNYGANEPEDNAYVNDYAAAADDFPTTHDYNEAILTGNESIPPIPAGEETSMKTAAPAVEEDDASVDGEAHEAEGTEVRATPRIAGASKTDIYLRSDPALPSGHSSARRRPLARFAHSELTSSAAYSEADMQSVGGAMESEEGFDIESETDEAATVKFRDQDTIAKGEDFSMIGMESLQTSINMSHSELPEMGETTSRIVSRTLESIRQGHQDEEGDSALSMFDFLQQSDPATPKSTTSQNPQPAAGSSRLVHHQPQSSPALSRTASPKKRAEPLGKLIARKSLHQVQSPAASQAHLESTRMDNTQPDAARYEDSFSEIPDSVLEAAVPQTTSTNYFSQQQADLTGRISQFQSGLKGKEPGNDKVPDHRPQLEVSAPDDGPILGFEQREESPLPPQETTTSKHGHDDVYYDGDDGEDEEEDYEIEADQPAVEFTSSPPLHLVQPQQEITEEPIHSRHFVQEGRSRATPVGFLSPRQSMKAPYVEGSERVDRLALPSEGFRPSLSPIVRAGRVLQSVTSDPPSPKDNEGFLRSPFRRSGTRDTYSPSVMPQNGHSNLDPEQFQPSLQPTTRDVVESPESRPQIVVTPSQPPLSASRKLWATALAPLSGLRHLVANGAQIISPRLHLPASAVPVVQSSTTPGAGKRSAETAQLDEPDHGGSSSRTKRLRTSSVPEAVQAARRASSQADPGSDTGRSWRSLVFREGNVAGSITSFASKLVSRNAQNPHQIETEPELATPSGPSPSHSDVDRSATNNFGPKTDEMAFSNDNDAHPATPSGYVQNTDDFDNDDDFDIWAVEASRPTPAPATKATTSFTPSKAPEVARDPRLVRLAASQIKKSVRKQSLGASTTGGRRYSVRPEEEDEDEDQEFSLLDVESGFNKPSQPANSSKRPAPFNLDDFFSSPVAVPRMLPPTSENNIRLNEQSRLETLERVLDHDRRRDAERAGKEGSQSGYDGRQQKGKMTATNFVTADRQQAARQPAEASSTGREAMVRDTARHERRDQSDFNVAFYGEPPASTTPPRNTLDAAEEPSWSHSEIGESDTDGSRTPKSMPRIRNVPRRRGVSRSQQARRDFLRTMRESSTNPGPVREQSPQDKAAEGGHTMEQSIFNEEIPSTPLHHFQRRVALPPSSSDVGASVGNKFPASRLNSRRVVAEPDDEPSSTPSQARAQAETARPSGRRPAIERTTDSGVAAAAGSGPAIFDEDYIQNDAPETHWGLWENEEQEPSYVESETSFLAPVLKPLPAKSASPTKSCMRSPAKGKTAGRVVEFAGSTMAADAGEEVMAERASMQQAALQFAEHFALDTENRVPVAPGPSTRRNAEAIDSDDDTDMMDLKEVIRDENRRRNGRGYEVDEELSEMMLSDAHEISTPLAFVLTPKVQAGRPYFHGANIPRASWRPPAAIELPPRRDWTLEDWLSMNRIVQEYRQLGPLNFQLRYVPERRGSFRSPGWTKERPSLALQRKVVHTEKEGMLIKDWHLDIVDAFYIKAGRIWNHHYLLRRLFSLFIGEARHGILLSPDLDDLYDSESPQ